MAAGRVVEARSTGRWRGRGRLGWASDGGRAVRTGGRRRSFRRRRCPRRHRRCPSSRVGRRCGGVGRTPKMCIGFRCRCEQRSFRGRVGAAGVPRAGSRRRPVRCGGDQRSTSPTTRLRPSVDHERQVDPAFAGAVLGDVLDPQPVGSVRAELTMHQVVGHGRVGDTTLRSPATRDTLQATFTHQALDHVVVDLAAEPEPQLQLSLVTLRRCRSFWSWILPISSPSSASATSAVSGWPDVAARRRRRS